MTDWASLIGAGLGAYASYEGAQQSNKRNASNGQVDITHQSDPWGPSSDIRQWLMGMGQGLFATSGQRWGDGPPGLSQSTAAGYGKSGGGGGGGGGRGGRGGAGVNSAQSHQLTNDLQARAEGGSGYYDPAQAYTTGTLQGQDFDPYRQQAASDNEKWIQMLFGGAGSGGSGDWLNGGGFHPVTGGLAAYNASAGGAGAAPVGAAKYAKEILDGKYLNAGNPFQQKMIDALTNQVKQQFSSTTLPGINTQMSGANALGSNAMDEAYKQASQGFTQQLADAVSQVQYGDYNNRMEDVMHALDTGAQLDENSADNASRMAAANASAAGSASSANLQMSLARMSALGNALGLSANIGSDFGGDQRTALGLVPELSNMQERDLLQAFGASNAMDQLSEQERASSRSAGIARAGLDLQRRGLDFNEWQYAQQAPYQQLGSVADIVNAASGAYGTQHDTGFDRRNASPSYTSPYLQAIAGGMAGYSWGQQGWGRQAPAQNGGHG